VIYYALIIMIYLIISDLFIIYSYLQQPNFMPHMSIYLP